MIKILERSIGRVSERMLALLVPEVNVKAEKVSCYLMYSTCDHGTGCGNQYDKFKVYHCNRAPIRRRIFAGCCQTRTG